MGVKHVREVLRIPESRRKQIKLFTTASQKKIYQGTIRHVSASLGGPDRAFTLADQAVLDKIDAFAEHKIVDKIYSGYHNYLDSALGKLPEGLSDEQIMDALAPFFARVKAYNQATLIPFTSLWTRGQAIRDFYVNNGLADQVPWECLPAWTDQVDACEEAIAASPMSASEAFAYDMPNHRNCPHTMQPILPEGGLTLPADLWTGEIATEAA